MSEAPSYIQNHNHRVSEAVARDLARSEYKTAALTYLALADNTSLPDYALVYAQMATAYATLEQARWTAKGKK